jgi:tape measure domain-containing protein
MSQLLEELLTRFVYDVDQTGLRKYDNAQKKIKKNTKEMIGLNSTLAKGLRRLFVGAGAIMGVQGLVKTYRDIDLIRRSIEGLTKSTQDWDYIQKEALRTGTGIESVAKGYRNFYSAASMAGFDKMGIQDMYSDVLTASRAIGATQQQVGGALLALEQMLSKGRVSMEELRRQLGNALPGAFEIGAKAMGVTTEKFNEMVKKGISAAEFVPKFTKELLNTYKEAFPEAIKSLDFALVNLSSSWKLFQYEIMNGSAGQGLAETINSITEFLRSPEAITIAKGIGQALNLVAKALGFVVKHFRFILFMFGVSALSKLPTLLNTIKASIIGLGKAGLAAGKSFLWLTLISTVLYGIYLIIQDIYTYIKHPEWESFTRDLATRFPIINKAIEYMKSLITDIKPILFNVANVSKDILLSFITFEKNTGLFRKGIKSLIIVFLGLGSAVAWVLKMVLALIDKTNQLHGVARGGLMGGLIGTAAGFAFGGVPGAVVGGIGGALGGAKFLPKLDERWKNSPNNPANAYNLNKAETTNVNNNQRIVINAANRSDSEILALIRGALNNDYESVMAMTNQTPTYYGAEA